MSHLVTKPTKWSVRPLKTQDKPGHLPSLFRVFAMHCMGSYGPKVSSCRHWRFWSDWVDTQADLSLRWAHWPFCWFCHEVVHMLYNMGIWIYDTAHVVMLKYYSCWRLYENTVHYFSRNFIFASIVDFDGWGITARYFYIRKHEALQIVIFVNKSTITKSWNK